MKIILTYRIVGWFFIIVSIGAFIVLSPDFSTILSQISQNFTQKLSEDYNRFSIRNHHNILVLYFAAISLLTGCLLVCKKDQVQSFLYHIYKACRQAYLFLRQLPHRYKIILGVLLLINIILKLYLVLNMPVFVDEAWTYWVFSQKGWLTSMSYYPAPNNHILHSLLTNISILLPIDKLIALRLPNFIINILDVVLFFIVFSKLFNQKISIFLTTIFSFSFPVFYYGYIARGYMIYLGAFMILFYLGIRILQYRKFTNYQASLWFAGSVIGFWSLPAFLYPAASLVVFISLYLYQKNKISVLHKFLKTNLIVVISVFLLYLPVLLVSGYKSLTANPYVSAWSRISVLRNLDEHFESTSRFLFNMPLWLSIPVFAGLIYYFYKHKWGIEIRFTLFIILVAPLIMLLHATVPMPRIWIYWLIPVFYILGILVQDRLLPKLSTNKLFALSLLIALLGIGVFFIRIRSYEADSFYAKDLTAYFDTHKPENLYIGQNTYLGTSVLFNFKSREKKLTYQEFFTDLNENDLQKFDYFLLRKKLDSNYCQKHHLKPVKVSNVKQNIHYLYQKSD